MIARGESRGDGRREASLLTVPGPRGRRLQARYAFTIFTFEMDAGIPCMLSPMDIAGLVVGIITGVVTIGFRGGQDALKLSRAANQMARDIRSTVERAVNSQVYNAGTGNENQCTSPDKDITPGYGVHFTTASYFQYVDCGGNDGYQSGLDEIVGEVFSLEPGVNIQSVSPNSVSVFFLSPDPAVLFWPSGNPSSAQIVLEVGGKTKTITITNKGVVNIN